MKNHYETKDYGFGYKLVLRNGARFGTVLEIGEAEMLAALNLYETLKEQFAPYLPETTVEKVSEFIGIESSWIVKLSFNHTTGETIITKNDGSEIVHLGVLEKDFLNVLHPSQSSDWSVGRAYNLYLKGKYPTA